MGVDERLIHDRLVIVVPNSVLEVRGASLTPDNEQNMLCLGVIPKAEIVAF